MISVSWGTTFFILIVIVMKKSSFSLYSLYPPQLATLRAANVRAGQLANLLEDSNKKSVLTPVVQRLAANLIQKMSKRKVTVSAPQTAKTTTVVTQVFD